MTDTKPKPLTKTELDQMTPECCDGNGKSEVWFHQACCPGHGTWTQYDRISAVLTVVCANCKKDVVAISLQGGDK